MVRGIALGREGGGGDPMFLPQHALHISFKKLLSVGMAGGHHLREIYQRQFIILIHLYITACL